MNGTPKKLQYKHDWMKRSFRKIESLVEIKEKFYLLYYNQVDVFKS